MSMTGDVRGGRSDIQVGPESVLGNERLAPCGRDGDAGSVGSVSAASSGDTEVGRALGSVGFEPAGYVGGKVGNDRPVAASDGADEAEAAELVDGVGDESPERPRRGDMELMEGHARTRPWKRLSTSCGRNRFSSGRSVLKLQSMPSSDSYVNSTWGVLIRRAISTPKSDKAVVRVCIFLMIPWLRSLKLRAGSAGRGGWARVLCELWLTMVAAGVRETKVSRLELAQSGRCETGSC